MITNHHNTNLGRACMNAVGDLSLLNEDYAYSIFVPDMLIGGNVEHVGTVDLRTGDSLSLKEHSILALDKKEWEVINNWDDISVRISELPFTTPGLLIRDITTGIIYHLKNDKFNEIEDLLGNNKSLVYLVCALAHLQKREEACRLLPNLVPTFKFIDDILEKIATLVYDCYRKRFIGVGGKKTNLIVHAEIHTIMQHMHKEYLERVKAMNGSEINKDLAKTKKEYGGIVVTKDRIIQRIWIYSPRRVYKLVNDYIHHQDELMKVSDFSDENLKKNIVLGTKF